MNPAHVPNLTYGTYHTFGMVRTLPKDRKYTACTSRNLTYLLLQPIQLWALGPVPGPFLFGLGPHNPHIAAAGTRKYRYRMNGI